MNHSVHDLVSTQFSRTLKALRNCLKKAQTHAVDRKFDENLFLQTRIAPDMFPLARQVQIACDTAKGTIARLSGKTAPSFADDEKTLTELMARIDKTLEYVQSAKPEDFADYKTQKISFPWNPGPHLNGEDYLVSFALPNFFFHSSMVYALLRAGGVAIGKNDFLNELNWKQ